MQGIPAVTFILQAGLTTRELAHVLDSLVRVSRRVGGNHFVGEKTTGEFRLGHSPARRQATKPQRFSSSVNFRRRARQEAPRAKQSETYCPTFVEAAGHPAGTWQSCQAELVPFASLSAISGTFNSLPKVLFIFPSWYLFAIGLEPIFSFG